MKSSNNIFITGCDKNTEWMLDWFVMNYLKHNSNQLYIMDFGMSERALEKHAGFVLHYHQVIMLVGFINHLLC